MPDVTPYFKRGKPAKGRKATNVLRAVRQALLERASYTCEFDLCERRGTEMHHRLRRSQGGDHTLGNLTLLCGIHHAWVHANPALAEDLGLLVRSGR